MDDQEFCNTLIGVLEDEDMSGPASSLLDLLADAHHQHRAKPLQRAAGGGLSTLEKAFVLACKRGNLGAVLAFIRLRGPFEIDVHAGGEAAFIAACQHGHTDVVRELLALRDGRMVNANDNDTFPLWTACHGGHLGVVEELLRCEEGQTAHETRAGKRAAFIAACKGGHAIVVRRLMRAMQQDDLNSLAATGILCACVAGHASVVRQLWPVYFAMAAKTPDLFDQTARTVAMFLRQAAGKGHTHVVQLICARLDGLPAEVDVDLLPAFSDACLAGHRDSAWALLDASEALGWGLHAAAALQRCVQCGLSDLVEHLLGVSEARDALAEWLEQGDTNLWFDEQLLREEHYEVVQALLDSNHQGVKDGLHAAALCILKLAIQAGCTRLTRKLLTLPCIQQCVQLWNAFVVDEELLLPQAAMYSFPDTLELLRATGSMQVTPDTLYVGVVDGCISLRDSSMALAEMLREGGAQKSDLSNVLTQVCICMQNGGLTVATNVRELLLVIEEKDMQLGVDMTWLLRGGVVPGAFQPTWAKASNTNQRLV